MLNCLNAFVSTVNRDMLFLTGFKLILKIIIPFQPTEQIYQS